MKARDAVLIASGLGALLWLCRPSQYSFKDKVVVITGGSRGLGLALAREFARHQAKLALLARDPNELERAATELRAAGAIVKTWTADVREEQDIVRTISAIAQEYGRIDVLINNAGVILVAPLEAMTDEDFEQAMAVHFWAPYRFTMAALPFLRRNSESRIVNISSIGGKVAVPHLAPYCASKFALTGFSDAMRTELATHGIRVTTVCPGLMRTGSHINAEFKGSQKKEFAWFSISAGMPFLSMSAPRAARQIVDAAQHGRAELTITLQARSLVLAQALAPNLFAQGLQLANWLLPRYANGQAHIRRKGHESTSAFSPSPLTYFVDQASQQFNEEPTPPV